MTVAYPLSWPTGWPRTKYYQRESDRRFHGSVYGLTIGRSRDGLLGELARLGAASVVISSNLRLRQDGLPYSDQRRVDDPGVAVYFTLEKRQMVMAADRFQTPEGNMRSLGLAIEAMRQLKRHGGGAMMERAFSGFAALPPPRSCWEVLGVAPGSNRAMIERAFRERATTSHPDRGGSNAAMAELNDARDRALREAQQS